MAVMFIPSKRNKSKRRWYVDYRDRQGIRHRVVAGSTKEEAEGKEREIMGEIENRQHVPKNEIPTFEKIGLEWFEAKVERNLSLGSVAAYSSHFRNHLKPYFGSFKLDEINVRSIENYLNDCLDKGKSRYMANKTVTTLGTIFEFAKRRGQINHNPVADVEKLAKPPHEHDEEKDTDESSILKLQEIRSFLTAAPENYRPLLTTAVSTGMRQGELLALKWGDIDWQSGQIHVRRSLPRHWKNHEDGSVRFNTPKTEKGRRRVDMAPELVKILKDWSLFCPKGGENLVFPSPTGNPESPGNMLRRGFYPALKKAGLHHVTFHGLRHTYASLLIDQGENIVYISEQLGHAKPDITLRVYAHKFKQKNYGSAVKLGAKIFGEEKDQERFTIVSPQVI